MNEIIPRILAMWGAVPFAIPPGSERPSVIYKYRLVEISDGEKDRVLVVEHHTYDAMGSGAWIAVKCGEDGESDAFCALLSDLSQNRLLIDLAGVKWPPKGDA
jgi:hypothetical protein